MTPARQSQARFEGQACGGLQAMLTHSQIGRQILRISRNAAAHCDRAALGHVPGHIGDQ